MAERPLLYDEKLKATDTEVFSLHSNISPLYHHFSIVS